LQRVGKWSRIILLLEENAMAKVNLSSMDVQSLLNLRKQVDEALADRRTQLERQLRELGGGGEGSGRRRGASPLAGKRVPPKYRSPSGETWAGRGARPRWLVAVIKGGKKLDDFMIDKSARKGRESADRSGDFEHTCANL
jgi:DNA-binding protein H-NS